MSGSPGTSSETTKPSWSASEAGALLDAEVIGDGSARFSTLSSLEGAGPDALTFVRSVKFARGWGESGAAAVLVSRAVYEDPSVGMEPGEGRAILVVKDADLAMLALLEAASKAIERTPRPGVHPSAAIDESATIGDGVFIGAHVTVGAGSVIGDGARLHPGVRVGASVRIGANSDLRSNVVIEDRCTLGARVIVHAGTVIGADGFGYRPSPDGSGVLKIPHIGGVEIGDDVEIGANTCIDRGKFSDTTIGSGTKIDNLVQVGHNVRIGRSCVVCGMTGIAGSATLGNGVTLGGGCRIHDGITIGDGATLAAVSGVMGDVPPGVTWGGTPAGPARDFLRQMACLRHLPELVREHRSRERATGKRGKGEA